MRRVGCIGRLQHPANRDIAMFQWKARGESLRICDRPPINPFVEFAMEIGRAIIDRGYLRRPLVN